MSTIKAELKKSKYVEEPHLVMEIDGVDLDRIVQNSKPGSDEYIGLVSTLLPWFVNEKEGEWVWSRIYPAIGEGAIAPVLMCPDDLDLWCTLIVADIEVTEDEVLWKRIGLETSAAQTIDELCSQVEWFDIASFSFSHDEYKGCVDSFLKTAD